jgi:hypothetical protein
MVKLTLGSLHLKTHQTYHCDVCDTDFRYSKDAKKDRLRHEKSKKHQVNLGRDVVQSGFVCPVEWCRKSTPRKDNLNRHIQSQHPEQAILK